MKGIQSSGRLTAVIGGTQDIPYGRLVTLDPVTDLAILAFEEASNLFIALSSGEVGDTITLRSVKVIDETFWMTLTEACSKGDSLYLDEQANEAAATGKLKKTAGNATRVLFIADDALTDITGKIPCLPQETLSVDSVEGLVGTVGGAVTIPKGAIVNYAVATGAVTLAFVETTAMYIALNAGIVGAEIKVMPLNKVGVYWNPICTEITAVGDALYLDEQANIGAATGHVKKTD